jgi:hypothetical protein
VSRDKDYKLNEYKQLAKWHRKRVPSLASFLEFQPFKKNWHDFFSSSLPNEHALAFFFVQNI